MEIKNFKVFTFRHTCLPTLARTHIPVYIYVHVEYRNFRGDSLKRVSLKLKDLVQKAFISKKKRREK